MSDEQNKNNENGYGQSSSGYGGSDTYNPTPLFGTPAPKETPATEETAPAVKETPTEAEPVADTAEAEPKADTEPKVTEEADTEPEAEKAESKPEAEEAERPFFAPDGTPKTEPHRQQTESQQEEAGRQYYGPDGTPKSEPHRQAYGQQQADGKQYYSPDGRPMGQKGENANGESSYQHERQEYRSFNGNPPPPQGRDLYGDSFSKPKDTFGVLALVCSIFSLILSCCGGLAGIVLGGFAIVFACMSKSRNAERKMTTVSKTAITIAIVGIVFGIFAFSLNFIPMDESIEEWINEYQQSTQGVLGGEMDI